MSIDEGSCRCCLLVGSFSDMWQEYNWLGEVEVYGDMIKECFGVSLSRFNSSITRDQICEDCIMRLRDAWTFKEQILNSNQQLIEHMTINNMQSDNEEIEHLESNGDGSCSDKSDYNLSDGRDEAADSEKTYEVIEYLENKESDEVNDELPKVSNNNVSTLRYTEEQLKLCLEAVKAGHLNQVQAAETFNIPRQTICFRLKQETGDNYKEVVSRWKKESKIKENDSKKLKLLEKESKLHECLEHVKEGSISMKAASIKYKISINTIKKAWRKEYGPNYNDAITEIKKKYVEYKRNHQEPKTRNRSNGCVTKILRPSKLTLMQAVTDVKDKKISILSASAHYNIRSKLLSKIISQDIDVFKTEPDHIFWNRVLNNYTESELANCVEMVRKGVMTQKKASEVYLIPEAVISKSVIKSINDGFIKEDCLNVVLQYTNAIPFEVTKSGFMCAYCSIIIDNCEELRLHTQLDHSNAKDNEINKADIIRLDILDLKCVICDKYIDQWHELQLHFAEHKIKIINSDKIIPYTLYHGTYICALCEEIYPDFKVLDMHMDEHFINYVCQNCGQPFFNLTRLHRHKQYCNYNKYICDICDKEFNVKYNLRIHIEDHMRPLKFSCSYCTSSFGSACERYVHIKNVHSEKLRQYPCKLCNKLFSWKPFYMAHYRIMHVRNSRFQCSSCREKFYTQISLEKHTIRQHRVSVITL